MNEKETASNNDVMQQLKGLNIPGFIRPANSIDSKLPLDSNIKVKVFFNTKLNNILMNTYGDFVRKAQIEAIAGINHRIICTGYGTNTHTVDIGDELFISADAMISDTDLQNNTRIYKDYENHIRTNVPPDRQMFEEITIALDFVVYQTTVKEYIHNGGKDILNVYLSQLEAARKAAKEAAERIVKIPDTKIISINK